jgi:hypothetical protein
MWKTLATVSLKGGGGHKTSVTPPLFIEVPVPGKERERSCICVLEVMYLCVRGHVFVC